MNKFVDSCRMTISETFTLLAQTQYPKGRGALCVIYRGTAEEAFLVPSQQKNLENVRNKHNITCQKYKLTIKSFRFIDQDKWVENCVEAGNCLLQYT